MNFEIVELFAIIMFFIAFYGLITSRNIIKSIAFTVMLETSVIMFFLVIGYRSGLLPPIGVGDLENFDHIADPLPQALMITAVIIGLSSTAVNIIMFITLFRKHQSAEWDVVKTKSSE
ncbi:MAG: cation:proton antiporter subunit C [Defluviitaleaceae bacterium]|nr:cation:proton antiporter subunit C [Defluviitaleaceae bacterium]